MSATAMLDEQERREAEAFARAYRLARTPDLPKGVNPLLDPVLVKLAREVVTAARGRHIDESSPFHYTLWPNGKYDVGKSCWLLKGVDGKWHRVDEGTPGAKYVYGPPGQSIDCTVGEFVGTVRGRTAYILPKGKGWVVEPTTNPKGIREDEHTIAMHALFLDSDGNGPWDRLLAALDEIGLAYLAYQSGGHSAEVPKWRVALFFTVPFPVAGEAGGQAWRKLYHYARVIFGALGELLGLGLDHRVAQPSIPWYLTERREMLAPLREVRFRPGASFDFAQFSLALPTMEEAPKPPRAPRVVTDELEHDDLRNERVIESLAYPIEEIADGHLHAAIALSDALLYYGFSGDDVAEIIEALWSGKSDKRQRDAQRGSAFLVGKNEGGDTSPADLIKNWPALMEALEAAIPDEIAEVKERELAAWIEAKREEDEDLHRVILASAERRQAEREAAWSQPPSPPPLSPGVPPVPPSQYRNRDLPSSYYEALAASLPPEPPAPPPVPPKPKAVQSNELSRLAKKIALRAKGKKETKEIAETIEAILTVMPVGGDVLLRVGLAVKHLAEHLPSTVSWSSLLSNVLGRFMSNDFNASIHFYHSVNLEVLMGHFERGQEARRKWEKKRDARRAEEQAEKDNLAMMASSLYGSGK